MEEILLDVLNQTMGKHDHKIWFGSNAEYAGNVSLKISIGSTLRNVETPSLNSGFLPISYLISCQCPEILSEISSFVASDAATKCPNIFFENIQWFHTYKY